ncbi:MAG: Crp/Fnr family transcriptional regulator [Tannerellaceae bacterium]|nr:Crp/Fnr family transcriptional regulator [Tannerellaceae bacterium]
MSKHIVIARRLAEIMSPLSDNTMEKLAAILIRTELNKNEYFLKDGQTCQQIGYIEKGLIRQFYYKDDKEVTVNFAAEDGIFTCTESFLRQKPTYLYVEALEPTVLYGIPYHPLLSLIEECPDLEMLYRRILEELLIEAQKKINSFRFETAQERYQRLLNERPELIKRVPLSLVVSYSMMSQETLSRVRAGIF